MARCLWITLLISATAGILFLPNCIWGKSLLQTERPIEITANQGPPFNFSDSTLRGIVWLPPNVSGPALEALTRMHSLGASAVRLTALPPSETLFTRADSLGLQLFIDLPVSHVAAHNLEDSLSQQQRRLERVQELARKHPSVQYVGLARHADTTVPEACTALHKWTNRIHSAASPLRTYYVTPFRPSVEQCAGAVDLALFDTRGWPHPVQSWRDLATDSTQTGIGGLGTWVRPDAGSGLRVPHSAERQARFLERTLSRILKGSDKRPPAVFVYRWADQFNTPISDRRYGLHDRSGTRRPAAQVVEGLYTGTQQVFAFPSGPMPTPSPNTLILLGWGLIVVLAGLFAGRPFVRQTAYRYFVAHGFYRDAVRKGRDVAPVLNTLLLILSATSIGLIATVLARLAATTPTTEHVLAALPTALSIPLATGIAQPTLAGTSAGGLTAILLTGWAGILALTARSASSFSVPQALMLVVWPTWPVLPGMVLALVATTIPPNSSALLSWILPTLGILVGVGIVGRVLYDYYAVSNVSRTVSFALAVPSPPFVLGLTLAVLAVRYELPLSLLWHLLTKT